MRTYGSGGLMDFLVYIVVIILVFMLLRRFIDKRTQSNLVRLLLLFGLVLFLIAFSAYRLTQ